MGILSTEGVWNRDALKITGVLPVLGLELRWGGLNCPGTCRQSRAGQGGASCAYPSPALGEQSKD